MKIIIHIENLYKGGIDTFVTNLIQNWPNKKDTFLIISNFNHPNNDFLKQRIGENNTFFTYKVPLFSLMCKKLPDYLNLFIIKILIFIFIIPIQFFLMFKFLILIKGDALLVVNGGYPGGETSRLTNIIWKILGRENNFHNIHNLAVQPKKWIEKKYEGFSDYLLIKSVDKFICVSKTSENFLRKRNLFLALDKVTYIHNGITKINKNKFNLKKHLNISKNSKIYLVLSSYEARKGHEFLIDSFKLVNRKFKNTHLIFIGYLNIFDLTYYELLKKKSIKNIHLLDYIPNASGLINQCDFLLLGSQEYESFGLVALEAMIQKVPVIATNIDAFCEVIGDNDLNLTVDKNDSKAFSNQMIKLLKNRYYRNEVKKYGFKRARLFSEKNMSLQYKEIIFSNFKKK